MCIRDRETAVEMIYKKAVEANGELEIVAIGPLTNIATVSYTHLNSCSE